MKFETTIWNSKIYQQFLNELREMQDVEYLKFHQNLIPNQNNIIGIRLPKLKEIAKMIAKGDYRSFMKENTHTYYEESMIHGLILGYLKVDFDQLLTLLEDFLPYNDNWAINDSVSNNLKQFRTHQVEGKQWVIDQLKSKDPWRIRFCYTTLLSHFINDSEIDFILKTCHPVPNEEYYVKMAIAWLLSTCYIKYPEKTKRFFQDNQLDSWTHNKAIQKTCESLRVSKEEKEYLRTLKRS